MAQGLGTPAAYVGHQDSPWLPAAVWSSPSCCQHLRSEPKGSSARSLCFSLSLSPTNKLRKKSAQMEIFIISDFMIL